VVKREEEGRKDLGFRVLGYDVDGVVINGCY
jgi:hypothetical protein